MAGERSSKRDLDVKLVYDCLANASGLVPLEMMLSHWPTDSVIFRKCETFWRRSASVDGFLDWSTFMQGLLAALQVQDSGSNPQNVKNETRPVAQVTSGEIERFLSSCLPATLVKALSTAGRDVHRWQVSLHCREGERTEAYQQHKSSLSATREKEELLRGTEVLRNTQEWFQNRLATISAEENFGTIEQLSPEKVLAEISDDDGEGSSFLHHLKQINTHLSSLALSAKQSLDQPLRSYNPVPAVQSQMRNPTRRAETAWPHNSASTPAVNRKHLASKHLQRSSSFTDKFNASVEIGQIRQTSSMTTLVQQQVTDYPGHRRAIPYLKKPIRHSQSVQSLPGQPLLSTRSPQRAHSSHSLTRESKIISEVL